MPHNGIHSIMFYMQIGMFCTFSFFIEIVFFNIFSLFYIF